jgi:hypothetical protein
MPHLNWALRVKVERVVQPTDCSSGRFSCSPEHEAAKEVVAWLPSPSRAGSEDLAMKVRVMRIVITLSSVAMIALAGGASLRGF